MIGTTLVCNAISPSIIHSFPEFVASILSSFSQLLTLSIGFILGCIPYLFLGLALGYLFEQKSVQLVALICSCVLAIPIFARPVLEAIEVVMVIPGKLGLAELVGDNVAAYSPIYHYIQLILYLGKAPEYDQYLSLHLIWLVWFTFISLLIALWAYWHVLHKEAKA